MAETTESNKKKTKTFKEYYSNPSFKEKYLGYVKAYIQCEDCGKEVQRCAMSRHRLSKKHIEFVKKRDGNIDVQRNEIQAEIQTLRDRIDQLSSRLQKDESDTD